MIFVLILWLAFLPALAIGFAIVLALFEAARLLDQARMP
jgi:hypothetical protein